MQTNDAQLLFKVLADHSRLVIVKELQKKDEICACELLQIINCKQATLSHHMSILVNSGLVTSRKDGNWVKYKCNHQLITELKEFMN